MLQSERSHILPRKFSLDSVRIEKFSTQKHTLATIEDLLAEPDKAIATAKLQKFAKITPQYPGIRAPLDSNAADALATALSPVLSSVFGAPAGKWSMQGWHSLVTSPPDRLAPIQRFPHVDGTDPEQIALMLYLHKTGHGGTAFFRHKSTGLEALTETTFPRYRESLERDAKNGGLPPSGYITDGGPYFECTHRTEGQFNQAILYHGNVLHSGVIDNALPLHEDPSLGRYTINAFLRPPRKQ